MTPTVLSRAPFELSRIHDGLHPSPVLKYAASYPSEHFILVLILFYIRQCVNIPDNFEARQVNLSDLGPKT